MSKAKMFAYGFLALFILVIVVKTCEEPYPSPTGKPTASADSYNEIDAYVMAQDFVKDRLVSPSTADFPWYSNSRVSVKKLDEARFQVLGYVDSQNGFGAMVRTQYLAIVKYVGDSKWICEKVEFAR